LNLAKAPRKKPPLPTEAEILAFIAEQPGHSGKREIARAFQIKGAARIELKRMLRSMADKGLIETRRKRVRQPGQLPNVATVRVSEINDDGELLCVPEDWDNEAEGIPPLIILVGKERHTQKETTPPGLGARLLVRLNHVHGGHGMPGHYEARTIRALRTAENRAMGIARHAPDGSLRLEPINKKERRELILQADGLGNVKDGDLIEVELSRTGTRHIWRTRIIENHGHVEGRHAASLIAISEHGLPHIFNEETLAQAKAAKPVSLGTREDLRELQLITIDPADARDRDDAIWAAPDDDAANEGGHKIIVAIADVAHFVETGTKLDQEAQKRGNSVYFPDRVIPMLPETLSNGLCSLNPKEDRAALAVEMIFDANGQKKRHRFMRSMISTKAALAYSQAQAAIDGTPDDITQPLLGTVLQPLWRAYQALSKARDKRHPLELELPERKIKLGDDGHIEDILIPERLDAHKLVEEFMIQANICAAETLEKAKLPLIYRAHETPPLEKIESLAEFLQSLNIKLAKTQIRTPEPFNNILKKVKNLEVEHLVHEVVLRSQSRAFYSTHNLGHFGLNLSHYAHFTSPIRRYADLCVHRALSSLSDKSKPYTITKEQLEPIAEHISTTERRAMVAEYETIDRLCAAFLSEQIGNRFEGRISGMTRGAMFIELSHTGADGIVPVSSLAHDYFRYDERRKLMTGAGTGETYRLGDHVEVRLEEAAPVSGALRFKLLSPGTATKSKKAKKPSKRKNKGKRKGKPKQ